MTKLAQPSAEITERNNPAAIYLLGLLPGSSRTSTRYCLDFAARFFTPGSNAISCPWHRYTHKDLLALRTHVAVCRSPTTANRMLSAVKEVMRAAWREKLITGDELQRIVDVKRVPGKRLSKRRQLPMDEIRALVEAAKKRRSKRRALRDTALVLILFYGGVRRAEAASLRVENCHFERGGLCRITVIGKGNKEREIPLRAEIAEHLRAWIQTLDRMCGPVFPRRSSDEQCMHAETVRTIVRFLVRLSGIGATTPHDARHTFITNLLDADVDVGAVQKLAGHANIQTTMGYDRRDYAAKVKAVERLPAL